MPDTGLDEQKFKKPIISNIKWEMYLGTYCGEMGSHQFFYKYEVKTYII